MFFIKYDENECIEISVLKLLYEAECIERSVLNEMKNGFKKMNIIKFEYMCLKL